MFKKQIIFPALALCLVLSGCGTSKEVSVIEPVTSQKEVSVTTPATQTQPTLSQEEQDFNNSGRAKAIIDNKEMDTWPLYENDKVGFSLHYPMNTILVDEDSFVLGSEMPQIKIGIREIGAMENPWDMNEAEALKNIEDLAGGSFGKNNENALESSKKVSMVGNIFAQDFMVLSRFEICNVTLEHKSLFYFNNKQIEITAYAPIQKVKKEMADYFTTNKENCGEDKVWNLEKQNQFYAQLANKKAPSEIQAWYDNFEKMLDTLEFMHK
ncbi:MAG: hypothetical protein WAV16_00250 [Candidatus Moraniibacteriota bacterium]